MAETGSVSIDLEFAAILINAVLLFGMGLAMLFADRIDGIVKRQLSNGKAGWFFPMPQPGAKRQVVNPHGSGGIHMFAASPEHP